MQIPPDDPITPEFERLTRFVRSTVPQGREQSLALTHIENGLLWARRAVEVAQPEVGGPATSGTPWHGGSSGG